MSPATSASRPENTTEHSAKNSDLHSDTTISRTMAGIGFDCFHAAAFTYGLPADLWEAPMACTTK